MQQDGTNFAFFWEVRRDLNWTKNSTCFHHTWLGSNIPQQNVGVCPLSFFLIAFCQGSSTVMLSWTNGFAFMLVLRIINGAMLASLKPLAIGLVADTTSETNRGKIYGCFDVLGIGIDWNMLYCKLRLCPHVSWRFSLWHFRGFPTLGCSKAIFRCASHSAWWRWPWLVHLCRMQRFSHFRAGEWPL